VRRVGFLTASAWPQLSPDDQLPAAQLRSMGIGLENVLSARNWTAAVIKPRISADGCRTFHHSLPDAMAIAQIEAVLSAVPVPWMYARVDACPAGDRLIVMEVELIEPSLLFDYAPPAAAGRFAEIVRGLAHARQ
jgi:hypothetical protein